MTYYVGIIDESDGVFGIRIPDCPGAFGAGDSVEEAIKSAVEGLSAWAAAKGDAPQPRPFAAAASEAQSGESTVLIPLLIDEARPVKVTLSIDAGALRAIDDAAQARGLTRSAFLASAARDKILAG